VKAVNSCVRHTSHKYGSELPTSVKHTIDIDCKNKNTFWQDALKKEMGNVWIAFEILGPKPNNKAPPGWHKAFGHIVFDVKMVFTRKACWVKDGHKTPDSLTSSFAGVVSCDSICISLTHAALLDLPVLSADIRNTYLQAPRSEKHFIICGLKFGIENEGRVGLISRALYGGKVAGCDFWYHVQDCMGHLGFTSLHADPDV
jgi:hypothetical protein